MSKGIEEGSRVGNYIPTIFIDIRYNFFHFIDIIYRYKI